MLTVCQNKICCKRACCFPDIKSPLRSQTGVRENVLTRSFKENRGFRDFQFQFYLTFSITLDISRVFEVGPLNPGWVIVFCTSENSTPQCLSPPRNINSLNWYLWTVRKICQNAKGSPSRRKPEALRIFVSSSCNRYRNMLQ